MIAFFRKKEVGWRTFILNLSLFKQMITFVDLSITSHIHLFFFLMRTFKSYSQQISIMQCSIINYSHHVIY